MRSRWQTLALAEAGVALIDCMHRTPSDAGSGYPYVCIPQMKNGHIDLRTGPRRITAADFAAWTVKARPMPNDVILSRRCNPGETAHVPPGLDFALGQNLVLLRADGSKILPIYLRWLARGPQWWEQVGKFRNPGAVFDSLKCADIPRFELDLPPIDEQRRISAVLGALDDKIELNRKMNETLEQMAQAIFKSWFIDFDGHTEFQDSPLGPIPNGWTYPTLDELVPERAPITYGVVKPGPHDHAGVYLVRGGDLANGWLESSSLRTISSDLSKEYARTLLIGGELLVSLVGNPGEVAIVPASLSGANIARQVAVVRPKNAHLTLLLRQYLRTDRGRSQLLSHSRGSVQQVINLRDLKTVRIPAPPHLDIEQFHKFLSPLYERCLANRKESQTLSDLRDTLLPKLISGEVRIKDAEKTVGEAT